MSKKSTRLEQLNEAKGTLHRILNQYEIDDLMDFILCELQSDIDYVDGHIEDEIKYIKWETNTYASAKAEAMRHVKKLRKNKQARIKAMKELKRAFINVKKVKDV